MDPEPKRRRIQETSSENIDNALLEKDSKKRDILRGDDGSSSPIGGEGNSPTDHTESGRGQNSDRDDDGGDVNAHSVQQQAELDSTVVVATNLAAAAVVNEYHQSVLPRQPPSSSNPYADSNGNGGLIDHSVDTKFTHLNNTGAGNESSITVGSSSFKPSVGSDEWHKVRRDNHKEVERRRRETINKGITELAKIVPDCDKHKGSILKNAVDYINRLKDNEQRNMEKLTLEKLLTEQAIAELSATNKALKTELAQAWKEVEHWKRACGVTDENAAGGSNGNAK